MLRPPHRRDNSLIPIGHSGRNLHIDLVKSRARQAGPEDFRSYAANGDRNRVRGLIGTGENSAGGRRAATHGSEAGAIEIQDVTLWMSPCPIAAEEV